MTGPQAGPPPFHSVYDEARKEADRHKWIESQKEGRDLGDYAIESWYGKYWLLYCIQRRVEHLKGERPWREFSDEPFGKLDRILRSRDPLALRILEWVTAGNENLIIINWALDCDWPMDRVVDILAEIDVNRARLDPRRRLE